MDKIIIKEAVYPCTLGITKEEQEDKQIVVLDIILYYETKKAGISDSINNTINYSEINKDLKKLMASKPFCLIEKVAEEVSQTILKNYPAKKVEITVKKPFSLKNSKFTGVSITREK